MSENIRVRVGFAGGVFLFLTIIFLIGGRYTLGVTVITLFLMFICLGADEKDFIGLIKLNTYRKMYTACFIVAVISFLVWGFSISISWLISGMFLLLAEPKVRLFFSGLAFLNFFHW